MFGRNARLRFLTSFLAAAALVLSLSAALPASAVPSRPSHSLSAHAHTPTPHEAAGNYIYECILSTGESYTMSKGALLDTCGGTSLQQYLGGEFVQSVAISGQPPTVDAGSITIECLVAGLSEGLAVYAVISSLGTLVVVGGLLATVGIALCAA
jgi:hypothetical protein